MPLWGDSLPQYCGQIAKLCEFSGIARTIFLQPLCAGRSRSAEEAKIRQGGISVSKRRAMRYSVLKSLYSPNSADDVQGERMAIDPIGNAAKRIILIVQDYSLFSYQALLNLFHPPIYWADFLLQADIIGVGSLSIVVLSGLSTGGVLALQSAATLSAFGATAVTGQFVSLTMIRELGPVLTGVMVSGRNASSMASELGSMVVTEQIDAMRALGVDPLRKLVTPRIFASIFMLFFLTIVADACGIVGGGLVTVFMNHQNGTQYLNMAWEHLRLPDIVQGLVKPLFFGFILASIGCFYGIRTTGGTQGVGRSTISAVVNASVLIIFVDFLISRLILTLFAGWM
jgi:phospholipid/cholesterol/gamma-HCH transport system permease protein